MGGHVIVRRLPGALAIAALAAITCAAPAQAPSTDIWVAALSVRDGRLTIGEPRNVTARPGYDNQPAFTRDGAAMLYTAADSGQTDIWRYDLGTGRATRLTRTPESEYSATPLPGGKGFSTVRVEADSTQRLWRFDERGGSPALVLERVKPVGYHAWGDGRTLLLFVLGDPATLMRADVESGAVLPVIENPGRSLQPIPGQGAISFIRKRMGDENWVMRYDVESGAFTPLVQALPESEDHAWTPDGTLLMAERSRLYAWRSGGEWREVAVFDDPAMARITRIAVSPQGDRIALVGEAAAP